MITYLRDNQSAKVEAEKAKSENLNTYVECNSYQCTCGESAAARLIDSKTLNTLEIFVECQSCYDEN